MQWQERVQQLMHEQGINQYTLADATGYSQPYINRLLKTDRNISLSILKKIADALSCSVEFLISDIERSEPIRKIPILKKDQIMDWLRDNETIRNDICQWLPSSIKELSTLAYATVVWHNDMINPGGEHSYPEGTIIIIDPEKPREAGQRIIAETEDKRIIFRELRASANELFLAALQPGFPIISLGANFNAKWCGAVVASLHFERYDKTL